MADFIYPTVKRITSHYGYRTHPITGAKTSKHHGTDFAQPGTHNVKAAAAGTVTRSYRSTSYGECVFILHNIRGQQFESVYAHMRAGSRRVNVGQKVKQGQVIGIMGSTGNSTGQHLHFELHKGRWNINKTNGVDPLKYLPSLSDPKVKKLQKNLKKLGYNPGKVDGLEGKNTIKAVKAFQRAEGLTVDGIAGKETKARIKHIKNGGMTMKEFERAWKRMDKIDSYIRRKDKELADRIDKKMDKPKKVSSPSDAHQDGWDFLTDKNISKGGDAYGYVTRQQLATMLKKYDDIRFSDKEEPSESHKNAWQWLVDIGVTNGIDPRKPLTREQFASLLLKYNDLVNVEYEAEEE